MIKQTAINKFRLSLGIILFLFLSFSLQLNLAVAAFLVSLFAYYRLRNLGAKDNFFLNLAFLFVIIFTVSYFIIRRNLPIFYIPFCAVAMLAAILFRSPELSLLISLAASVTIASIAGFNLSLGILFFTSGLFASILVLNARRRSLIIRAGFLIGCLQALVLFFMEYYWKASLVRYAALVANGIVSSMIVLGVLPVFEYLFRTITNVSLLELADFDHPLLHRMIMEAAGTYHHSLIVGNLSEAACSVVPGTNPLLARIGAYYHDIGKLQKPAYFSENQDIKESKHDALSPTISKMVIMNHVKDGVELAKKYKLSPALIDFIQQHHGNSLVFYFYRRALEGLEEDQEVREEGFRYPGPRPNTKETAIVLLADSVEAATRALRDPTPAKIEELVHKVINNKFIDGQLDACELTLKDLEQIAGVFIRILSGIYHSRITYPESPASESNRKKPAKENSSVPREDKEGSS